MQRGSVKFFEAAKGLGVISPEGGSGDLFVHQTAILMEGYRELFDGQRVAFDVVEGNKPGKVQAANVTVIQ